MYLFAMQKRRCVSMCCAEAEVCICVLCSSRGLYLYAVLKQRCVSVCCAEVEVDICEPC